jgi:type III pantothenate kinase
MNTAAATPTHYLFDLGNSRLKFAPLRADGGIGEVVAIAHDGASLPPGWNAALPPRFEAAFVASVAAPAVRVALIDGLTSHCALISLARTLARTLAALAGLRVAYAEPAALGVDRFLAMLGARARNPAGPTLVVGVGTAITLDLIDGDGLHRGGRIAPSPALMREALHARAAQLPEHGGELRAFADNTLDALRSGCDGAALALVAQAWADAHQLLGTAPLGLFHGGGAAALLDANDEASAADPIYEARAPLEITASLAPSLVLEGLAAYASAIGGAADTMPAC